MKLGYKSYMNDIGLSYMKGSEILNNIDLITKLLGKTKEEIERLNPVNIMLIGKTGAGKSTLINSMFRERLATTGIGRPITQSIERITKEGVPITLYDTKGLELNAKVQKTVEKEITSEIKKSFKGNPKDRIHLAYYCINAAGNRIEQDEIDLMESVGKLVPVIVVLTQSLGDNAVKLKDYIYSLGLNIKAVVNVLAVPLYVGDIVIPEKGLTELLQVSFRYLPEDVHNSFTNAQHVDIQKKVDAATRWANGYVATTFGVGFAPIPFADASILVPMQITMLAHITAIFGISMDKQRITSIIAAIGGTGGATYLGRYIVSNVLKLIPGVGTVAGGLISGATASLLTTALARSYIQVLAIIAKREKEGINTDFSEIERMMKEAYETYLKNKDKE